MGRGVVLDTKLDARAIIARAKSSGLPDKGVTAITYRDRCIMDDENTLYPYKCEGGCPDYGRCSDDQYMLACLATRDADQVAEWVVGVYNEVI